MYYLVLAEFAMFIPQEVVTVHRPDRPAQTFQHQAQADSFKSRYCSDATTG